MTNAMAIAQILVLLTELAKLGTELSALAQDEPVSEAERRRIKDAVDRANTLWEAA